MGNEQRAFAVCGVKNSGKTTLICALIPIFKAEGLKVAVIKHDGHSFTPDCPGTDTFRFFQKGADAAAVFDGQKAAVTVREAVTGRELIEGLPRADIILLEGFKRQPYPKLEVVRGAVSQGPVCEDCAALVTDLDLKADVPLFGFGDTQAIAKFIISYLGGKSHG